ALGALSCGAPKVNANHEEEAIELAKNEEELKLNLLCLSPSQCDDNLPCTIDLCIAGICVHTPNLGCCGDDSDCDTDLVCGLVNCVLGACIETPILGCEV